VAFRREQFARRIDRMTSALPAIASESEGVRAAIESNSAISDAGYAATRVRAHGPGSSSSSFVRMQRKPPRANPNHHARTQNFRLRASFSRRQPSAPQPFGGFLHATQE
jgi:hypothetical protein